jgi:putative transposase
LFHDAGARQLLRESLQQARTRRHFETIAAVLLPDHLHCIWTLPAGDSDFSTRWRQIKAAVTRGWLAGGSDEGRLSSGKRREKARGVWEQRYWEHTVRDEEDLRRHVEYIFYNPVKHGHARCVHDWPWSTFQDAVKRGWYDLTWGCSCDSRHWTPPDFSPIEKVVGE